MISSEVLFKSENEQGLLAEMEAFCGTSIPRKIIKDVYRARRESGLRES